MYLNSNMYLDFFLVDSLSNGDTTTVVVEGRDGSQLCVASWYFQSEETEIPGETTIRITKKYERIFIGCDANAHNFVWGSSDTNGRGECLLDFILESNFIILNRGNAPTFSNKVRDEVIDLTLASQKIGDQVTNWRVLEKDSFSDHKTIYFSLSFKPSQCTPKRNIRKTNWDKLPKDIFSKKYLF